MNRRKFLYVPPAIISLNAMPSFARPGSVLTPEQKKFEKNIFPPKNAPESFLSASSPPSGSFIKFDPPEKTKNPEVQNSLDEHLQKIWARLRDFFLKNLKN